MAKILVVDDDPATRALVSDLLELEGHQVHTVPDGFAALRQLQANRPDCMVLDVMMPGMDGHSVLDRLRGVPHCRDLPVIMLTAVTDAALAWQAWSQGVQGFLTKPFDAADLLDRVTELTGAPARR